MTIDNKELLTALETERRYVARELHDSVAQTTLQLGLQLGIYRKLVERGDTEELGGQLVDLEDRIQRVSAQIRELIADLRRPLVEPGSGLIEYLQHVIDAHHERGGATVTYRNRISGQLPTLSIEQIVALARIVQEALLNIRKHAAAKNVLLDLSNDERNLYVTVADDGKGFDLTEVKEQSADKGGAGLANLQVRARAIGGTLNISRGTTAGGTAVTLAVPVSEQSWW